MTFQHFIRLLKENIPWIILFPLITALTVFYFTRNEKKEYLSKATIYTGLASGYSIQSVNKEGSMDYMTVSNAFDNLITTLNSNETMRRIGMQLLAQHLQLTKPDSLILGGVGFAKLQTAIPANYRTQFLKRADSSKLYTQLDQLSRAELNNPVRALLDKPDSYYSAESISKKLHANRKNSSDMLEMEYEADDRAVAQNTLNFAISTLNKRYKSLKSDDATPVIDYFEGKSQEAKQQLEEVEAKLRAFNVKHEVINFEDETKNLAFSREGFVREYTLELMRNKAAKAALDVLQKRMGQRGNLLVINEDLIRKQAELAAAETDLISAQSSGHANSLIPTLETKVERITNEMKEIARRYYAAGDSPESIPQAKLVEDWLGKVIESEESNARLEVYKNRLEEYQKKTSEYSPLGSDLHQLRRELEIAEKKYLALTESLNEAQVHRQDLSVDNLLKILDPPTYPHQPKSSKRWLFVALGLAVGLFIALLITVIRFLLDNRLTSPENTEVKVGKPVMIVFPKVKKFSIGAKESRAAISMFEQLGNAINIDVIQAADKTPPPLILLFSMRSKQGKTWIAHGLARLYAETGQQIAYFYPRVIKDEQPFEQDGVSFFPYSIRPGFMNANDLSDLMEADKPFSSLAYHKIILELPPLISSPLPVYLLNKSHVSLLVIDANSVWGRKERQLMDLYNKISTTALITVLNRVETAYIEAPTQREAEQILVQPEVLLRHQKDLPTSSGA